MNYEIIIIFSFMNNFLFMNSNGEVHRLTGYHLELVGLPLAVDF